MMPQDTTVYLSDQQGLLSRFTQGLAGRYLHLRCTDVLTGSFRPAGATTDGLAIYLPEFVNDFDDARENLGHYRAAILHQLGYYEFGTFDFSMTEAAQRLTGLMSEPPPGVQISPQHDQRPVDLEFFFDRFRYPALARKLFLLLEDYRIDCRLPISFPGIKHDLARAMALALSQTTSNELALQSTGSPINTLLGSMLEFSLGASSESLIQRDSTGHLESLLAPMRLLSASSADVYSSAQSTIDSHNILCQYAAQIAAETSATESLTANVDHQEPGADSLSLVSDGDLEIAGAGFRGDLIPELVQRRMRMADAIDQDAAVEAIGHQLSPRELAEYLTSIRPEFDPGVIEDSHTGTAHQQSITGQAAQQASLRPAGAEALARLIRDELEASRIRSRRDESVLRRALGEKAVRDHRLISRSFYYDEWDYLQQSYLKGWCRLFEHRLGGHDYDYFRVVRARHRLLATSIANQLRRIRAESLERVKRVSDGDELDLDRLMDAVVDRRAGWMPDDRVYSRKERTKREVATAFLLDISASTDDAVPDPNAIMVDLRSDAKTNTLTHDWSAAPSTRRVIDVQKDALVLISEALAELGDAFGIYGFSGYGRDEVEFYVAKEFDEALNARTKAALAAMEPKRSTRMGPAIRHTVRKLQHQDQPLKVLIILSDGFPQDFDYGPDRNDHEYGIQDTARAIREAEYRKIATFCITVDQSGHDYLRRMCAEDRYLVIHEIESLPSELSKIYQRLTV